MKKEADTVRYKGSELIRAAEGGARDILTALLSPEAFYTSAEVADKRKAFLEKEA